MIKRKSIFSGLILLMLLLSTGCDMVKEKVSDVKGKNPVDVVTYLQDKEKGVAYKELSLDKIEKILEDTAYTRSDTAGTRTYRSFKKPGDGAVTLIHKSETIANPEPTGLPETESGFIGKNVYLLEFKNPTTNKYHATMVSGNTMLLFSKTDKQELKLLIGQILTAHR